MAPYLDDIHPYAARRLIKLFELLSKKYKRIASKRGINLDKHILDVANELTPELQPRNEEAAETDFYSHVHEVVISNFFDILKSSELTTYSDLLHMLLKIINSILTHSLARNPHIIYSLLYQQDIFLPYTGNDRYGPLANNIKTVMPFLFRH